jgi:hypothetical protein
MLNKKNCGLLTACLLTGFAGVISAAETCTAPDAITKSTLSLAATSQICETTAKLDWTTNKSNGTRTLSYGKSTSYGTNVNVSIASRRGTTNLSGLSANTTYYFKVDNIWEGALEYTLTGTFKTNTGAVIVQPPVISSAASVSCTTSKTTTYTAIATDPANKPITFSYTGLQNWMTANGAVLTLKPVTGSPASTPIKLIASNGSAADTQSITVTVIPATSIKLVDLLHKTQLGINGYKTVTEIALYSLNGATVYKKVLSSTDNISADKILSAIDHKGTFICSIRNGQNEIRQLVTLQK